MATNTEWPKPGSFKAAMLTILREYPDGLSTHELSQRTGKSLSHVNTALAELQMFLEIPQRGFRKLSTKYLQAPIVKTFMKPLRAWRDPRKNGTVIFYKEDTAKEQTFFACREFVEITTAIHERQLTQRILADLTPRQSRVVRDVLDGFSFEQIAHATKWQLASMEPTLREAMARMIPLLAHYMSKPGEVKKEEVPAKKHLRSDSQML